MRELTEAEIDWLWDRCVNHDHGLMAVAESVLDSQLRDLLPTGAITHYDSMFGNRYYALTPKGKEAIKPRKK